MNILYLPNEYSQQRQKEKAVWVYPVRLAMEYTYRFYNNKSVFWVEKPNIRIDKVISEPEGIDFNNLPYTNRILTKAFDEKYQSYGNYMYTPATHSLFAEGCSWGKCKFCVEKGKPYKIRAVDHCIDELENCYALGFKEVFDDSATFPDGEWFYKFCDMKIKSKNKIVLGCNLRLDSKVDFKLMKKAGFRMILVGVETSNQAILNRINKGTLSSQIIPFFKKASEAGLHPHAAVMLRYPFATDDDDKETLECVHYLLKKGYAKTAQASVYDNGQKKKGKYKPSDVYKIAYNPEFWFNKLKCLKSRDDVRYLLRSIKKGLGYE